MTTAMAWSRRSDRPRGSAQAMRRSLACDPSPRALVPCLITSASSPSAPAANSFSSPEVVIVFSDVTISPYASAPAHGTDGCIKVASKASLVHLGSLDSFDITEGGTKAAIEILDCVEHNNPESARRALAIYRRIIPGENFGGEYPALQWLCEYLIATPAEQRAMLADRYVASFYHVLADDHYAVLKEYLRRKYHLAETPARDTSQVTRDHRGLVPAARGTQAAAGEGQ